MSETGEPAIVASDTLAGGESLATTVAPDSDVFIDIPYCCG